MGSIGDLREARVYVGTYYKYNCGSLFGKWIDLSDYSDVDEFYQECRELHKDEEDPELMFQDYENIPENLISECSLDTKFFSLRDAISELCENEITAFFIWCNNGHKDFLEEDADDLLSAFEKDYVGSYDSEEDFAEQYLDEIHSDLSDFAKNYFDYESYARDLFCGDFWFEDGYVFRNV